MMDRNERVTSALDEFVKTHLPHSSIGAIDDIVLTYLVGILEEVGNEDSFDVEVLVEMMGACIPGFGDITSATICEWIFQLSREVLSSSCTRETAPTASPLAKDSKRAIESSSLLEDIELPYTLPSERSTRGHDACNSTNDARKGNETLLENSNLLAPAPRTVDDNIKLLAEMFPDSCKVKVKRCLSDSHGDVEQAIQAMLYQENQRTRGGSLKAFNKSGQHEVEASAVSDDKIQLLLELFPGSSELHARRCLSIANGDLEQASQVLLDLQESGEIEERGNNATSSIQSSSEINEKHVKESLLQKYGYIDTDDDRKNHRPMEPKKEKKKMVRYINSRTVTTKGERFIETKKPESEEMKKTYTNLKPARKYHFH